MQWMMQGFAVALLMSNFFFLKIDEDILPRCIPGHDNILLNPPCRWGINNSVLPIQKFNWELGRISSLPLRKQSNV